MYIIIVYIFYATWSPFADEPLKTCTMMVPPEPMGVDVGAVSSFSAVAVKVVGLV